MRKPLTFKQKLRNFNWRYVRNSLIVVIILVGWGIFLFPGNLRKGLHDKTLYRNETCVIVGTNENAPSFSNDKFHKPIVVKVWLIQRVSDTTQFAELTSIRSGSGFRITNKLWYEKGLGDTLYFDYILKARFFTINKNNK